MKFEIENLGPLKNAAFELGAFTMICGHNNTGKTYATYAMYGFLSFWQSAYTIPVDSSYVTTLFETGGVQIPLDSFRKNRNSYLEVASREYTKSLARVFAANPKNFSEAKVLVSLSQPESCPARSLKRRYGTPKKQFFQIAKGTEEDHVNVSLLVQDGLDELDRESVQSTIGDAIQDLLYGHLFPNPFIASAERTGAAIFRNELNITRNRILEHVGGMSQDINPLQLINSVVSDYALPVKNNVEFTRNLESIAKQQSFISETAPELLDLFADIIGGAYKVTNTDELYFIPQKSRGVKLTMDESSSAVRSLLDIGFYLRHIAQKGDLLIVDEPELNLHPANQRRLARLLARLVRLGIKIFITTHSDYIVRELNTLIMLGHPCAARKRIAKEEQYSQDELLSADDFMVYQAKNELMHVNGNKRRSQVLTLVRSDVSDDFGIDVPSFDETINEMNRIQERIFFAGAT